MNFLNRIKKAPIAKSIISNRNRFKIISQYPDCKSWWTILWEMNVRYARPDFTKHDYMELGAFRKSEIDPRNFVSKAQCDAVNAKINRPDLNPFFDNKLKFHVVMAQNGIPMPPLLGSFVAGAFWVHPSDGSAPQPLPDAMAALARFRGSSPNGCFFAKKTTGSGGHGAFKVTPDTDVAAFGDALDGQDFLFESVVEQTASVARFNPESLNTFRLYTISDPDGQPRPVVGQFRVGRGGAVVDNASSGGISAAVDMETGRVVPSAIIAASLGGGYFEQHPETGCTFGGFAIPFFDECCELACQYALILPTPVIGWDFALCEDGPLLIEGNRLNGYTQIQNSGGPILSNPLFKKYASHLYDRQTR